MIYYTFTFGAGVKATLPCFLKILEAGNHHGVSWNEVANKVSSGWRMEIFTRVVYHPVICCILQNSLYFMCYKYLIPFHQDQAVSSMALQKASNNYLTNSHIDIYVHSDCTHLHSTTQTQLHNSHRYMFYEPIARCVYGYNYVSGLYPDFCMFPE